jgi:hypothetical protein
VAVGDAEASSFPLFEECNENRPPATQTLATLPQQAARPSQGRGQGRGRSADTTSSGGQDMGDYAEGGGMT